MLTLTLSSAVQSKQKKKSFYSNITYRKRKEFVMMMHCRTLLDAGKYEKRTCLVSSLQAHAVAYMSEFLFFICNQAVKMEASLPVSFVLTDI